MKQIDFPKRLPGLAAVGLAAALGLNAAVASAQAAKTSFKFDFGPGKAAPGSTQVLPTATFTPALGYGFDAGETITGVGRGGSDPIHDGLVTSDKPFLFSVAVPEGNYKVTVTLGDAQGPSTTTVKAEARRLMLEQVQTAPGKFATRTFIVNVRTAQLPGGGTVRLKGREKTDELRNWDDLLTLEFNGAHPCVDAVEISKIDTIPTLFLAGDSTVTDQGLEPWSAWGQILPRFFKPTIAVANYAESGETVRSFVGEKRLDKILSVAKPGDYLFIQFAHNDMKEKGDGVGPFTTYATSLKSMIDAARQHNITPVLVTPMNRRNFDAQNKIVNTFITSGPSGGDYVAAVRQVASEEKVALIDLNAMSKTLFETMGPDGTLKAFVHYPANSFPGQTAALADNTHFNTYGAYELAKCIAEGIKADKLGLAKDLATDVPAFDPAHPDSVTAFDVPASPMYSVIKPYGS